MFQLVLIIHFVLALVLIVLVLVQRGKGADVGAAFGSGASTTMFGSKGSGGFLLRFTFGIAALFFITSITLTYIATKQSKEISGGQAILTHVKEFSQAERAIGQMGNTLPKPEESAPNGVPPVDPS